LELQESYEKRLVFLLAGNSEKERRSLCYKDFNQRGLAVPHFKSRLAAIRCQWVQGLRDNPGIFRHSFHKRYIDWQNDVTFKSAFPKEDTEDFA
jgi:hypothetical protein